MTREIRSGLACAAVVLATVAAVVAGAIAQPSSRSPRGRRWTTQRKIGLLNDIAAGELSPQQAFTRHGVTQTELDAWERRWAALGKPGLMITKTQELRT